MPEQVLLRTLLDKSWVRNGKPHYYAFRPQKRDTDGISLFFEKESAGKEFDNPIYGFLDVYVGSVRDINNNGNNLDVIQDRDDHALIIGIPNYRLMPETTDKEIVAKNAARDKATFLATEIAEKASRINDYRREGFSPKDLLKND